MSAAPSLVLVEPTGRQPPEDPEAEASLVAALLRAPDRYFEVGGWLNAEHFGTAAPRWTYAAIADIHATQGTVDLVTVRAWLEDRGHLARVGGREGLHAIVEHAAPSDAVDELAARIVDRSKLRALIAAARRIAIEGHGPQAAAGGEAWLAEQAETVAKIAADGNDGAEIPNGVQLVSELYESWHNPDKRPRLNTGLPDLDRALRGMMPGQMIIVGAHSGRGKSALAANIATHVLLNERLEDKPSGVLVFSLEMSGKEYIERMGCALARIDSGLLDGESKQQMTREEGDRFIHALRQLSTEALRIDERQDMTIAQIRAAARKIAAQMTRAGTPLRLVVIDYAQIVSADAKRKNDNREQEVSAVGRETKKLAKEIGVPVLLLAQLNEDARKDKRKPSGRDLRESRGLLQNADKIILIHNPAADARDGVCLNGERHTLGDDEADVVELLLGKNRRGKEGFVRACFWPSYTTFGSWTGREEDLPAVNRPGPPTSTTPRRWGGGHGAPQRRP